MTYMDLFLNYIESLPDDVIYLLLGLSAFGENIFPPIPGDTITAFGAFLVGIGRLRFFWVYISTTLGSLFGFMSLFWIGNVLGRRFFIGKDYRFFKVKDIIKVEEWYRKYGYLLIALNRFLPGIRSVISVAGGISRLNLTWVAILALLSCALWNMIWIFMGYVLGTNWETIEVKISAIMLRYNITILALFVLVIFILAIRKKYRKKIERGADRTSLFGEVLRRECLPRHGIFE
ncbi:MAG: DedA family protein [Desulfatiglandales bacterium]|nr:DedA family protein [Desulfatiglandales bacterium]